VYFGTTFLPPNKEKSTLVVVMWKGVLVLLSLFIGTGLSATYNLLINTVTGSTDWTKCGGQAAGCKDWTTAVVYLRIRSISATSDVATFTFQSGQNHTVTPSANSLFSNLQLPVTITSSSQSGATLIFSSSVCSMATSSSVFYMLFGGQSVTLKVTFSALTFVNVNYPCVVAGFGSASSTVSSTIVLSNVSFQDSRPSSLFNFFQNTSLTMNGLSAKNLSLYGVQYSANSVLNYVSSTSAVLNVANSTFQTISGGGVVSFTNNEPSSCTVFVTNSSFANIFNSYRGGAFKLSRCNANFVQVGFSSVVSSVGSGAIHSDSSSGVTLSLNNTAASNCSSPAGGFASTGALVNLTVTNSRFSRCSASSGDGGTFLILGLSSNILGSSFVNSSATGQGGVLNAASSSSSLFISSCTFNYSSSNVGGVFYFNGKVFNMATSSVFASSSQSDGGAV
jgi:hypothetical protein